MFSRSCRPEVFCKKDVPNFAKFTGKHLWQSLFFNIVAQALDLQLYYKKKLWYRCCPVNFEKFLSTPFFIEHFRWLLLVLRFQGKQTDVFRTLPNTYYKTFLRKQLNMFFLSLILKNICEWMCLPIRPFWFCLSFLQSEHLFLTQRIIFREILVCFRITC